MFMEQNHRDLKSGLVFDFEAMSKHIGMCSNHIKHYMLFNVFKKHSEKSICVWF